MRSRLLLLLGTLVLAQHPRTGLALDDHAVTPLDRVIAVVNDGVNTSAALDQRITQVTRQLQAQHIPQPPASVLRRQVLKRMILDRIQLQIARRMGIKIHSKQVDRAMAEIASRNHMTASQFAAALGKDGIDVHDFRKQLRTQLVIREIVAREIRPRVRVSEREVRRYLAQERNLGERSYHIRDIFIPMHGGSQAQVRKSRTLAQKLEQKLHGGARFSEVAIAYSQGPDALRGGDVGWKRPGQLPSVFLRALATMKPGQVSAPLETPDGIHIIKLLGERTRTPTQVVTQTHVRRIVIRPSVVLSPARALARAERLRSELKSGVHFGALARRDSDDALSASSGGDLGWVNPGQLDPEVEAAMQQLPVGKVSAPIQTSEGVELIEVLGRRKRDISAKLGQFQVRRQLEMRRAGELYNRWLRRLREHAYVRIIARKPPASS
ncbi:MAG: peptidylprolyl isomerase [Acidiferrobacteraceae bacterium]